MEKHGQLVALGLQRAVDLDIARAALEEVIKFPADAHSFHEIFTSAQGFGVTPST